MSLIDGPIKMFDDLFNAGHYPLIILGLIGAIIYLIFYFKV
jgi:hypothetical protein